MTLTAKTENETAKVVWEGAVNSSSLHYKIGIFLDSQL